MPELLAGSRRRVGVVEKNQNPYWDMVNAGWADAADRLGLELVHRAPASEDIQAQRQLMSDLLDEGVDALAFVGTSESGFDDLVERAQRAGTLVVTFDLDSARALRTLFVGMTPPVQTGRMLGRLAAERLPAGAAVIVQAGSDRAPGAVGKLRGILEELDAAGITAAVTASDGEDVQRALRTAASALDASPEAVGMLGVYGYHPAVQAAAARSRGRKVTVLGFDMLPETVQLLQAGEVAASIWIREYYFGYLAAVAIHDLLTLGTTDVLDLSRSRAADGELATPASVVLEPEVFTSTTVGRFVAWSQEHGLVARTRPTPLHLAG